MALEFVQNRWLCHQVLYSRDVTSDLVSSTHSGLTSSLRSFPKCPSHACDLFFDLYDIMSICLDVLQPSCMRDLMPSNLSQPEPNLDTAKKVNSLVRQFGDRCHSNEHEIENAACLLKDSTILSLFSRDQRRITSTATALLCSFRGRRLCLR